MQKLVLSKEYIAGWWDGEGCFSVVAKPTVRIRAQACSTYRPMLQALQAEYGGSTTPQIIRSTAHRQAWQWTLQGKAAARFASDLLPFLNEKRSQAELIVEAINLPRPWSVQARLVQIETEIRDAKKFVYPRDDNSVLDDNINSGQ